MTQQSTMRGANEEFNIESIELGFDINNQREDL